MIIGVYGYQDSGKTALVEELVRELSGKGYRVSSVKHSPHTKEVDAPGKDTWRHSNAGSDPVALQAADSTVIIKKPGLDLDAIVKIVRREFCPDILIVEGHKEGDFPKIAVGDVKPTEGTVMVNPELEDAVAYIEERATHESTYDKLPKLDCGKCDMTCANMASEIVGGRKRFDDCIEMPERPVEILIGGRKLPVGAFVARITEGTVRGLLSSLKGYSETGDVEIRLRASADETKSEPSGE
ncbi:MAG: molybdopterin-guanine dinucleotide biosynthesis protein B [Thermoplasmata archaeon]|nr:molybdopterin-guanine dinucleotide biosynthesis protein B [Thermoplasmata archaeon]